MLQIAHLAGLVNQPTFYIKQKYNFPGKKTTNKKVFEETLLCTAIFLSDRLEIDTRLFCVSEKSTFCPEKFENKKEAYKNKFRPD